MKTILLKGGTVVNANGQKKADVLIENQKITAIGTQLQHPDNIDIINASQKFILPGGIDPHVHFHLKTGAGYSADDFLSGSKAALAGGTTSIIDFVTPEPGQSLEEALELREKEAANCLCHYSFHMTPISWNKTIANEMGRCVSNLGIGSFKTYMAYTDSIGLSLIDLEQVFIKAASLDALVLVHAENDDLITKLRQKFISEGKTTPKYHALSRPPEVEYQAVKVAIDLAKKTGAKLYFVHVSTKESVELIKRAQHEGFPVFAETCPQYLLFDAEKLEGSFKKTAPYVFSPALHDASHKEKLWQALHTGVIQSIGTDHCPFNLEGQKDLGRHDFTKIPNGTAGVQHRLELLYTFGVLTEKISFEQMVNLVSTQPAQIFNLKNKGKVAVGYDADIVIWNSDIKRIISAKNHWHNCDHSIYEGMVIKGKAETVILGGKIAFSDDKLYL